MTIHVVVTQEDIDKGRPKDGQACPVARALQRAGHKNSHVTNTHIEAESNGLTLTPRKQTDINLPPIVRQFISNFDRCLPVQPFEFDLEVPECS